MDISTSILSTFYSILLGKGIASGLLSIQMQYHNGILLLKNKN